MSIRVYGPVINKLHTFCENEIMVCTEAKPFYRIDFLMWKYVMYHVMDQHVVVAETG